jgi:hypothetical protein
MQNLNTTPSLLERGLLVVTLLALPLLTAANLPAQERPVEMTITAGDKATTAALTSGMKYHLMPARTAAGKAAVLDSPGVTFPTRTHVFVPIGSLPSFPANTGFYPSQLFKAQSTGATMVFTQHHPIYIDPSSCGGVASCWGNPAQFLTDLGKSTMIHLLDTQYVPSTVAVRYTLGTQFTVSQPIYPGTSGFPTFSENDVLTAVHNAAKLINGTGLTHLYHVFLPRGVDHCMDEGPCYSPDNLATWVFCAYHFTVKFADLPAKVYYTVEPFQDVPGCQAPTGTPNGQLADSTYGVLSHETFESITDPDITTGFRSLNNPLGAVEIGDLCDFIIFGVSLNGHAYAIQSEYSNKYEACATTP